MSHILLQPQVDPSTSKCHIDKSEAGTRSLVELWGDLGSGMGVEMSLGGVELAVQGCGNDHFLSSLMLLGSENGPSRLLVSTARTAKWYTCPGMN